MKQAVMLVLLSLILAGNAAAYDFEGASKRYGVPRELLEAISKVESGHNSLAVNRNRNGSVDLGHMQVNSGWQKSGKIDWKKLTDANYCTYVGAWVLAQEIERYQGNVWAAVAAYNTGRSASQWEKDAQSLEGEKRFKALELAQKARKYTRAVYAAYARIMGNKGQRAKEDWRLERYDGGAETVQGGQNHKVLAQGNQDMREREMRVLLAPMAVVNPYGSFY